MACCRPTEKHTAIVPYFFFFFFLSHRLVSFILLFFLDCQVERCHVLMLATSSPSSFGLRVLHTDRRASLSNRCGLLAQAVRSIGDSARAALQQTAKAFIIIYFLPFLLLFWQRYSMPCWHENGAIKSKNGSPILIAKRLHGIASPSAMNYDARLVYT